MMDKILVTYASRTGTTAGVAEVIGRVLADGPAADGYNVRAYIVRGNNIYEMTLRKRPGN